jgi:chromosome segregation ATPase
MDCRPRGSELIASDKLSRIVAAQEDAQDALQGSEQTVQDAKEILSVMGSEIEEVAQEYQDSASSIREYFSESETADECEEKAYELEDWAQRLQDWEPDDDDTLEKDLDESGYLNEITDLVEDIPI